MGCILISSDRGEGRCWQRLEDRWWWVVGLRTGEDRGAGLWARSRPCSYEGETNWSDSDKWTISSSPTASFLPIRLPFPTLSLFPIPLLFSLRAFSTPVFFIFHLRSSFSKLSYIFFALLLFLLLVMLFYCSASCYNLPVFSLFHPVARAISEVFSFFFASWKRGPAAFYYEVDYLVRLVDRLTPAHSNDFHRFCFMSPMRLTWHLKTINCLACIKLLLLLSGIVIGGCY